MKKLLVLITIAALIVTVFAGCGSKTNPETQTTEPAESVTDEQAEEVTSEIETDIPVESTTAATGEDASETNKTDGTEETSEEESTEPAKAPETIEEIVEYYNTAVNKVKPTAKTITRTYHHVNIPTDTLELPSAIQGLGETAIKQFVKDDNEPQHWTTKDDFILGFPVGGENYSSKMTPDMVKSATCKDNGKTYTITIVLKNDSITSPKKGQGYAGVFNTVAASTFDDINIPTVTFEKVNIKGINGKITCTVDKETQRVTDITFANTDILDLGVKVAFSNLNAKMNLVCEDNYKITY
ncbi:MAG: hypothetical protein IK063_07125 [Clostridia bacterium]|nr:hypothetical protein [Clostridia bacterium]